MRALWRLRSLFRSGFPIHELDSFRCLAIDAYELVDELPRGPARLAAWNAYVLQTYADKLVAADRRDGYVPADTVRLACAAYELAGGYAERARQLGSGSPEVALPPLADALPRWHTRVRSRNQLVGMRETLEALRIYIAYGLSQLADGDETRATITAGLAAVDAKLETVDRFWIARPPEEIRGGIGTALTTGLDAAYSLGRLLVGDVHPA